MSTKKNATSKKAAGFQWNGSGDEETKRAKWEKAEAAKESSEAREHRRARNRLASVR